MGTLNKSALKRYIKENGLRISGAQLDFASKVFERIIKREADRIIRKAVVSGRKNIRKEDISDIGF